MEVGLSLLRDIFDVRCDQARLLPCLHDKTQATAPADVFEGYSSADSADNNDSSEQVCSALDPSSAKPYANFSDCNPICMGYIYGLPTVCIVSSGGYSIYTEVCSDPWT